MTDAMTFDPSPDVLYHGVALRHVMELPVLGIPVRFESNSPAAIARGGVALLLAGPPGTGKSTLAYQAHRRGLRVLSDDAVYVQLDPELRVWGLPGRVRLLTTAVTHFPELAGRSPTFLANGNEKLVVQCPGEWPAAPAPAPVATRARVCLLERTGGSTTVSKAPASSSEVQAFLTDGIGL